jgi:hypothetical protein
MMSKKVAASSKTSAVSLVASPVKGQVLLSQFFHSPKKVDVDESQLRGNAEARMNFVCPVSLSLSLSLARSLTRFSLALLLDGTNPPSQYHE